VAAPNARASVTETIETAAQSAPRMAGVDEAPAGLSWTAFGERYFPGRRRHDLEVLRAYASTWLQRSRVDSQASYLHAGLVKLRSAVLHALDAVSE
jgi:hypothetical protein